MGKIVLLDDLTINQIAAGEVIERPASVVKELVENSIDAGAKNVTVEIKNGGISYIRVMDDGSGIMPDDMDIAFERHATSKIRQADDLNEVKSMGFRGEALASIAAIAKVELVSRTEDEEVGYKVIAEGGDILDKHEEGAQKGTSITVKELFFNTPVRYKFLKKDFTESGYVEDIVTRIALSNPDIAIKYINAGKTIIQTNGNGKIEDCIYEIFGREVYDNILPVDYEYENYHVTGVIGKPIISRSNRTNQIFFVNRRHVKDKTLASAAQQGFKGLVTVGKHGFLVLNIDMDASKVDVNVHPTKLEVRFQEDSKVFKAVYHAIKETLLKSDLISDPVKDYENTSPNDVLKGLSNKQRAEAWDIKKNIKQENEVKKQENIKPKFNEFKDTISGLDAETRNKFIDAITSATTTEEIIEGVDSYSKFVKNKEEKSDKKSKSLKDRIAELGESDEDYQLDSLKHKVNKHHKDVKIGDIEDNDNMEDDTDEEDEKVIEIKNNNTEIEEKIKELFEKKDDDEIDEKAELEKEKEEFLNELRNKNKKRQLDNNQAEEESKNEIEEEIIKDNDIKNAHILIEDSKIEKNNDETETEEDKKEDTEKIDVAKDIEIETINTSENVTDDAEFEKIKKEIGSIVKKDDFEDVNEVNDEINEKEEKDEIEIPEEKLSFEEMYKKLFGRDIIAAKEEYQKNEQKEDLDDTMQQISDNVLSLFDKDGVENVPPYQFIGIAFKTYIILTINDEMYIMDQHAAHERIMYEKVKANYNSNQEKESQLLLLPDVINLTNREMGIYRDNKEMFRKAGFVVEEFGDNTVKITGVPDFCVDFDNKEIFLETLDEINTVARTAKQELEDKFLATVACKAAVKAGMKLSKEEVDSIIKGLLKLPNPFSCPHGRPTIIKMTKNDIEKKFSRR